MQIVMSNKRALNLLEITWTQRTRTRDYIVSNLTKEDVTGFDEFANLVRSSQQEDL